MTCYNCLDKTCTLLHGRFPKICLDENTKRDIGLLWICAYTECGRGHPDREMTIKEECAKLCNKPVDKDTDRSDNSDSNETATKAPRKRPAKKNNNPNPNKKRKTNGKKEKATPGQKVKHSKQ